MKPSALSLLLLGYLLLTGCGHGQGVEGVRGGDAPGAGGSNAVAGSNVATGGSSAGTAVTSSGSASGGAPPNAGAGGTSAGSGKPCGPAWMAGTDYAEGDIVLFQGGYYIAEHDNPGYDPVVSSYFWEPYVCSSASGGAGSAMGGSAMGGSGPLGDSAFADVVSESVFHQMFPDRNGFYTYQGLLEATRKYPAFAGTGTDEQRKREAAAFLANVARETGELVYIEQIQKDDYCSSSDKCPCQAGKQYYGRGPIQISWNYNYCSAGSALGYDLRAQPELVAQNATIAWATGLWFWMTQAGAGQYTPHNGIVEGHGFGETIRSINGSQECNGGWPEAVTARVTFYQQFCALLGVTPGDNMQC